MSRKQRTQEAVLAKGIRRRGNSIQLDFYYEGIRCRESLRLDPGIRSNVVFAEKKLSAINYDIAIGVFNYARFFPNSKKAKIFGHTVVADKLTVTGVVEWYLKQANGRISKNTLKEYEGFLKNHIAPSIGKTLAKSLKPSHIKEWLANSSGSAKAKNNRLSLLRPAFQAALVDEIIDRNPFALIEGLTLPKREPKPYTPDQVDLILNNIDNEDARCFYQVGFWTGLSPSERRGLQWDEVELDKHRVLIRKAMVDNVEGETKNKHRWRQIDLLPPAESALRRLRKLHPHSEWVFINPETEKVWDEDVVREYWSAALKASKLPHERSYVTRHTFASILLSMGVPLTWIQKQMGHSNYRMLEERYARWIKIPKKQKDKILNWFLEMSEGGCIPDELSQFIRQVK